jgi:hypothetical protein
MHCSVPENAHLQFSIFQAHVKRQQGDISGSRVNKQLSQRIIAQFGEQRSSNGHYSKQGIEHAPQALCNLDITQNNTWVCYTN